MKNQEETKSQEDNLDLIDILKNFVNKHLKEEAMMNVKKNQIRAEDI